MSRLVLATAAALVATAGAAALALTRPGTANAQVPVVEGKGKVEEYWSRAAYFSIDEAKDILVVAPGRRLFITDISVSNVEGETQWVSVERRVPGGR